MVCIKMDPAVSIRTVVISHFVCGIRVFSSTVMLLSSVGTPGLIADPLIPMPSKLGFDLAVCENCELSPFAFGPSLRC